ncbi:MAG: N-acetyl-gamma-glutamyl-phosphate reductase [Dysgonamonadaceae bacterium]|jgi:N-acetyl-gamma-glutamyl-phosphate reductase|nr:N-acetyl-gamma-glutamyl-phosphate reductase [Dysgonamonadaceae bacterium]
MYKAGVIGGAGYTAGELLRLLVNHPDVEINFVHSKSNAGKRVAQIHSGLEGETDLIFTGNIARIGDCDVLFLCSAHGDSRKFMEGNHIPATTKIVDLSADYRYGDSGEEFVYGLSEINKDRIRNAVRIANPGCFATAIQLALLPLAVKGLIDGEVHVHAITGSTGAGVKLSATSHFSWRNNNVSVYKPFIHQHLNEISETLRILQPAPEVKVNFIPVRGNFTRGIFATAYTSSLLSEEEANMLYRDYYKDSPFTKVVDFDPDLKQVVNTNKCLLHVMKHDGKLLIVSVIDNLLKGASGQAVQNFNIMSGLDETAGLRLKAAGF